MGRTEKTVFISYRRANFPWALAVYQDLTAHGYDVFFDFESIKSGDFEQTIVQNIKGRAHFVLILTPSALERCNEPGDWLRREIELALDEKRNIVPLMLEGFNFSSPATAKYLTGKLATLQKYNGLNVPVDYFNEAMQRLREERLNVELSAVLHPISTAVREVVQNQQAAADKETQIKQDDLIRNIGYDFKSIALGSNSSFVFLYGSNGHYYGGVPQSLVDVLKEKYNEGADFKSATLGPNSSYIFFYGSNGYYYSGIPQSLANVLKQKNDERFDFKDIALGPNSSFVFFYGSNGYYYNGIPQSLIDVIKQKYDEGHEFKAVALGPNSSFVFFYGLNGYYYSGIPDPLINVLKQKNDEGFEFKAVALGPNSSYAFFHGYNGYYYNGIPDHLAQVIKEKHG